MIMILRVGVPNFNFYPKLMKDEKTGEWSGVYIDFLEELKKKANFSYSFVINELNSFDDTVKSVAENRTDITVPGFVPTIERHRIVDFSVPFFSQGLYIWIKKPEVSKKVPYSNHIFDC